jgi:hypothetical protein
MIERDGVGFALVDVWPGRQTYGTALRKARQLVRLLNAGEAAIHNAPTSPTGQGAERTLPETGNSGIPPSPDGTSAARQHGMNPLPESDHG